jgi:co-chaperonin GroES (HSP10)
MVQLIKPKTPNIISNTSGETSQDNIPKDPEGIKKYLGVIPDPVGYRLLIRPYQPAAKTKGGIHLSDTTRETIQMTTVVGLVVKMGDLCYKDKDKFPDGPWCKSGDFVIYGRYSGSRFQTKFGEHRILNDDEIIGRIKNPEDILHLF